LTENIPRFDQIGQHQKLVYPHLHLAAQQPEQTKGGTSRTLRVVLIDFFRKKHGATNLQTKETKCNILQNKQIFASSTLLSEGYEVLFGGKANIDVTTVWVGRLFEKNACCHQKACKLGDVTSQGTAQAQTPSVFEREERINMSRQSGLHDTSGAGASAAASMPAKPICKGDAFENAKAFHIAFERLMSSANTRKSPLRGLGAGYIRA
jgi:hypothetical protein